MSLDGIIKTYNFKDNFISARQTLLPLSMLLFAYSGFMILDKKLLWFQLIAVIPVKEHLLIGV